MEAKKGKEAEEPDRPRGAVAEKPDSPKPLLVFIQKVIFAG